MELQVGDRVKTPTMTGKIVSLSFDGNFAYVEWQEERGAALHRFPISSLQKVEQPPDSNNFPSAH
jgi:hypothetical protein